MLKRFLTVSAASCILVIIAVVMAVSGAEQNAEVHCNSNGDQDIVDNGSNVESQGSIAVLLPVRMLHPLRQQACSTNSLSYT